MRNYPMHPMFMLMAVVGVISGLFVLHQRVPALLPVILVISLVGLLFRVYQLSSEGKADKSPKEKIDFQKLVEKNVAAFAPWLKDNIRGHNEAVDRVVGQVQKNLRLAGPGRTLGNFMFVGPTGTGKTFLAELIGQAIYPESEPVILRMNQYKDHQDVFTLIGPPPGQPGYEVGGALTRPVMENPYRVVILDEIEKAHADVQHCLYDVLDTAQCREKSSGKMIHFNACAFFATCNAGVGRLRNVVQSVPDPASRIGRMRDSLVLAGGFDKAFLARFSDILLLDELSPIHVAEVACLQIAKYWRQFGIEVTYTSPELLVEAMKKNVEFKEYGVRQLARLIQDLTDPSIEQARSQGVRRVRLEIDRQSGRLTVGQTQAGTSQ